MSIRFTRLADVLTHLYNHHNGMMAEKLVSPATRSKVKDIRTWLIDESLAHSLLDSQPFTRALYEGIAFGDENPPGSMLYCLTVWEETMTACEEAINASTVHDQTQRDAMLQTLGEIKQHRESIFVSHYHKAGDCLALLNIPNRNLETTPPDHSTALKDYLWEYYSFPKFKVGGVDKPDEVAYNLWKAMVVREGDSRSTRTAPHRSAAFGQRRTPVS